MCESCAREDVERGGAQRRHVLIVEDAPAIRALLTEFLAAEGFQVDVARDGQEALRKLTEPPVLVPHVVLLDMMLPRVDGVAVLRALARNGAAVSVVAMSADREALVAARRAGAHATVAKPFDLDALLRTLECQATPAASRPPRPEGGGW